MNETATLKKLVGTVVYRKDENESKARIGFKPDGSEETEWYTLWRKNYQTKLPNPADSQCVKGAYGKLVLRFKRGGPKVKGDPTQGFYDDEWQVYALDPIDGEASDGPGDVLQPSRDAAPPAVTQVPYKDQERASIEAQKSADVAERLYATERTLKGGEYSPNAYAAMVRDVYRAIQQAKESKTLKPVGDDPFQGE